MGLGRSFTRPAAAVAQRNRVFDLASPTFAGLESPYGGTADYRGVLSIPAVNRSVSLISGLVGTLPLHAYRDPTAGSDDLPSRLFPTPTALSDPAAGHDTPATFFGALAVDALLDGNAIAIVAARNAEGWPTAWVPVPAYYVQVRYAGGTPYNDPNVYGQPIEYRIGNRVFSPYDVLHIKAGIFAPGALRGCGVLERAFSTMQLAGDLEAQARSVSQHGVPTGILQANPGSSVSPEQMAEAKEDWLQKQQTRTIAGLSPDITWVPISWDPTELQLLDARRFSVEQIALLFGLPAPMLNVAQRGALHYTSSAQDGVDLLKFTLDQLLIRIEQALNAHLPRGNWCRFNRDAILATDVTSRYASYQVGISGGFLLPNEVRRWENLPPLPDPVPVDEPSSQEDPLAANPDPQEAEEAPTAGMSNRSALEQQPVIVNITNQLPEQPAPSVIVNPPMVQVDAPNVVVNIPRSLPTVNVKRQELVA